ncbi:Lipoprotein-releasing system transmembrane protein LolE [Zhongshania aliphaticivorans]|uniref:Lipoprotein-releasing system transmembrane protein LolE n=1 Tax=Zhongshania aliphaticivorans TaxID=1470434 RepID=A0A5S9NI09_9GAMM|nr:lipoprotein-releasing ABC transporter permease subunit [Zhongshania aliphaticivorans]CAA0088377.1 Lipoprotein-releasing system transmembrane protein LolE [Zhongshania aliphaticivorans]CAA0116435.1 Lipoprotein-releasing system transmembrane protein LolE [Zhongshania aliphaticivorans]CAA0120476.1 Lipoprotein-releasing system transmembrane protein LolE [Zhongshania aliphaticivorans]
MAVPLYIRIGLRYFHRASGSDRFLSLISWFSLLGMLLGTVSLIVVMSVMNGFERELQQRVLSVVPHGYIEGPQQRLANWRPYIQEFSNKDGVVGVAPYVGGKAMLSAFNRLQGVALYGIEPEQERSVSAVAEHMVAGQYLGDEGGNYSIILGDILARQLGVNIGDDITVILPKVTVTPFGLFPREKRFRVSGVFSAGAQLDATSAFIHISDAQRLYQLGGDVEGLRIQLSDMFAAPTLLAQLATFLPEGSVAESWGDSQGSLFQAVKMEKHMVRLLLLFIVLIAAFNIVSILSMAVSGKRGSIAVLRTMGASPQAIMATFMVYGMATGITGLCLGLMIGIPLAMRVGDVVAWIENLSGMQVFNPDVYFITRLPSYLQWSDVGVVSGCALLLSLMATLYPAWQASRVQPAEALRYE